MMPASVTRVMNLMTDPDQFYIVCPYRIGDMVIVGVLTHAVLAKFNRKSAALIVQDLFKGFNIKFDGVSEIKYASPEDLLAFKDYVVAHDAYVGDNYVYGHYHFDAAGKYILSSGLNFFGRYTQNIFGLPAETKPHAPVVGDISDEAKAKLRTDYIIDKNRTVILAPHCVLCRPLSLNFWQMLIDALKQNGCIVYTNVGKKIDGTLEQPLDNTLPMRVSLNEIFWLADKVRCIIGMRSGLLDLLAFSPAKIFCLAHGNYHNDLKLMFPDTPSKIRTLYRPGAFTSNAPLRWHVPLKNVFTNERSLLHALIELFKDDPQSRVERIFKRMIDPDKLYIVCTYRLGDMLFVGGLSHAMSERFDKSSVVLIVKDRLRSLELSFDGVSEIKYAANDDLQAFQDHCRETNIYLGHNWIYGHYAYNEDGEHMYSGRLNFLDRYRSDILGLPLDTPYRPPHIRDISDEAKAKLQTDYILDKNRTVIIAPVTNTYRDLRKDFWHRIVERLQQSDAIVYTNIGRNNRGELEPPLEGTAPLNVSLNEMFWLADKVKCIIGFRSGLFDLLAFSKAKLLCIAYGSYHNDINLMFPNNPSRLVTLYLMRKIDSERLARWKINADNVFTDADALSESLLRDVLGDRVFSRD